MSVWIPNVAVGAAVLLAGVSLLLAVVGFLSFLRVRHARLLWIALAFVGFLVQGLLMAWNAYLARAELAGTGGVQSLALPIVDLVTVLLLYVAVMKR